MIVYTVTAETKATIVAALVGHGADPRMSGALGRVPREESPLALSGVVGAWPAEADGMSRVSLSDSAGIIVWRAYAIAEIAAGRGRLADLGDYCEGLGVATTWACDYVCAQMKGSGIRPCPTADRQFWTDATDWVVEDGKTEDPRKRWASSAWRSRAVAHDAYAAAGLVVAGRGTWKPLATMLFAAPKSVRPTPTLSTADEVALAELAT